MVDAPETRASKFRFEYRFARNRARSRLKSFLFARGCPMCATGFASAAGVRKQESKGQSEDRTFFILGTGPSINELRDTNWDFIANHQSLGLNYFAVHPFVPNYYFFEQSRDLKMQMPWVFVDGDAAARNHTQVAFHSSNRKLRVDWNLFVNSVHPGLVDSSCLYLSHVPLSTTYSGLVQEFSILLTKNYYRRPALTVVDPGFSAARALWFALSQGFKRIVLAGIDLRSSNYFYQDATRFHDSTSMLSSQIPWPSSAVPTPHVTEGSSRRVIASQALGALAEAGKRSVGSQCFVSSGNSQLADFLPVFDWDQMT